MSEFWEWLTDLNPVGGSKLAKAVTYSCNHKSILMNYLLDGRCEISNNTAEWEAKVYATTKKNFMFHNTENGVKAGAIVFSIIETARSNGLNPLQYLYTLLLFMPDPKDSPTSIKQLMPWSIFIQEQFKGFEDTETYTPKRFREAVGIETGLPRYSWEPIVHVIIHRYYVSAKY